MLVLGGTLARLLAAIPGYLNPDEILHVMVSSGSSFADTYQRTTGIGNPHPPLYYLVLYGWQLLGRGELWLRLPTVLASGGMLWFAFQWLRLACGRAAALAGLIMLAFAPEMIRLGAQVREYGLLLFLVAAALYLLERGLRRRSAIDLLLYGGMLCLAAATHYSAFWLALGLAVYGLVRLVRERMPVRVTFSWFAGQACVAGLGAAFVLTHITRLVSTRLGEVKFGYLADFYFRAGENNLFWFPIERAASLFQYLFSSPVVGVLMLVLFGAGLILLASGVSDRNGIVARKRATILLFVLPLIAGCVAAFAGVYPFGGSRHSLYLVLFVVGGIAVSMAWSARGKLLVLLAAAVVLVPVWNLWFQPPSQYIAPKNQRRELMSEAMDYIRELVPPGGMVFMDYQTEVMLRHYLCGLRDKPRRAPDDSVFVVTPCHDLRMVRPAKSRVNWNLEARQFGGMFREVWRELGLAMGDTVTVVDMGWGWNLAPALDWLYKADYPNLRRFGDVLSVFQVVVGSEPAVPEVGAALESVVRQCLDRRSLVNAGFQAAFWPTDHFSDSTGFLLAPLADEGLSYATMRGAAERRERHFSTFLPALAFWVRSSAERHPGFMRLMDGMENYATAGYRFVLVLADPESLAAVYVVTTDVVPREDHPDEP